jgi:MOSC domain-containing protein YiiM
VPRVVRLFRAPKRGWPMEALLQADAIQDAGFAGCSHGRAGTKRQLLLVDRETLDALALSPGMIRENITTEGLNVNGLQEGETLRIGDVLLEVTMPCTPCSQMDDLRPGLRREIRGRRGMLCRVLKGGTICQGQAIEKLEKPS